MNGFREDLEAVIRAEMAEIFAKLKVDMIKAFNAIDADNNGFLSKDEIKKVVEENVEQWGFFDDEKFDKLDENDDGKISIDGNKMKNNSPNSQNSPN